MVIDQKTGRKADFGSKTTIIEAYKKNDLANTKRLVSKLQNMQTVNKIRKNLSKRYESRKGGYTRIIKLENRKNDNAKMLSLIHI